MLVSSASKVSIEGDTVIVAAPQNNEEAYPGDGYHAGAGYIFTRSGTLLDRSKETDSIKLG